MSMDVGSGPTITLADLWPLELYEERRQEFRQQAMAARGMRRIALGNHLSLLCENRLTIFYQIMEMLRSEKVINKAARQHELDCYNPLISDANNLRATLLIEYADSAERDVQLRALHEIERHLWLRIGECEPVYAIANEDQSYAGDPHKTSAVHYLRYPLSAAMSEVADGDTAWCFGADHLHYVAQTGALPEATRSALQADRH